MTRTYGHYCAVAHALEIVGDRWSLLIIRDLLRHPQRFSDLLHFSSGITPKWLTLRLRQLEEAGIIKREKRQDHREVWYRLTPAGQDFRSVVEALGTWGSRYAMPPPLPEEEVHPELAMDMLVTSLNRLGKKLSQSAVWQFKFTPGGSYSISFNGDTWVTQDGKASKPDVVITTTPRAWAMFLAVKTDEGNRVVKDIQVESNSESIGEFLSTFRVENFVTA